MDRKLNVVYFYNRPGWAFEFEANYYLKYSSLNVTKMLESNFDKMPYTTDIAVLPSCLHYNLLINEKSLETLKRKNIRLVVQCNSHKEVSYNCPHADLIMASSKKLYSALIKKYSKSKVVYQPHFVDTQFFQAKNKFNNFTVGWVGDIKNPFKRVHLIPKLTHSIKIKSDFKKSKEQNLLQKDMPEYYNDIDVLIILSESEGTPMPLLEALSCGKLVISTDVGIASEILPRFFIINAKSDHEIVKQVNQKLDYIKNHFHVYDKLMKKIGKLIKKKYDWRFNVNKLDTLYINLFKKRKKTQKFISPEPAHTYLKELSKHIPIEFNTHLNKVKETNYPVILWNPYGYLVAPKLHWKYDIYKYRQKNNKPTYILERGALPSSIFLDCWGFLAESNSYREEIWDRELCQEELNIVENYIYYFTRDDKTLEPQSRERISEEDFKKSLNLDSNKKIVFVPMQVCKDTVIQLYSDWIGKLENLEPILKQIAQENKDIIFLVKNHPVERNYKINPATNIKIVDNFHYKDCIAYSDCVLTINSSVGLQAMMWNKPVITLGKSFYNFVDINRKAESKEEIVNFIKNPLIPNMEKVKRFIYYLKFMFYTHCEMEKTGNNSSRPTKMTNIRYENKETGYMEGQYNPQGIIEDHQNTEKISVLIPIFNREKWVRQSLESITKQTYRNLDIVIYDDGSTDNTLRICKEIASTDNRIRIIEGIENKGVAEARNQLLKNCETQYAVWHDSDDFSNIHRIDLQYKAMQKKEQLIFGTWDNLSYHGEEWRDEVKIQTRPKPRPKGFATLMFPVRQDIGFDPDKKLGGEDWDWIDRMKKYYGEVLIPERVYYINFHRDKIGQWKKVLSSFPGIDINKMSYKEMQDYYKEKTGKDIRDAE